MKKLTLLSLLAAALWTPAVVSLYAVSSTVVISEFRVRGPNGGSDEFIELYNLSSAPVSIGGWKIKGSNNTAGTSVRATIASGAVLNPGCFYLLTNSSTSGGPYSGPVAGDQTYAVGITDDGGIALTMSDETVIVDQVGMHVGSAYKEGTILPPLGTSNLNRGYERKPGGAAGHGTDSDNNQSDFQLIAPSNPQNSHSQCIGGTDPVIDGDASPNPVVQFENLLVTGKVTPGSNPPSTNLAATADLAALGGADGQQLFDDGTNGDVQPGDGT